MDEGGGGALPGLVVTAGDKGWMREGGALPGLVVTAGDKGWMREGEPYLGWWSLQQGTRDG